MPNTRHRPSARELLGGRWAISLRVWVITSVVLLLGGSFGLKAQLDLGPEALVVLTVSGWLLFSMLYLGAHLTVFRHRRTAPVHVAWLVGLGLLVGGARAATVFALPESRAVLGGGWTGAVAAVFCFVPGCVILALPLTYLIAVTDWYATERTRLLRFEVATEAARLRAIGALNAARAVITTRIQTALEERLSDLERAAKIDDADDRLSDALLDTAIGYVRPVSHRLWHGHDRALRRTTLSDLERQSLAKPLPIAIPFALWTASLVPVAITRFGGTRILVLTLTLLIAMTVIYPLGRAAIRRYAPAPHYLRARLIALVAMVAAAATGFGPPGVLGFTALSPLQRLMPAIFMVVLTIGVSWAQAALRTEDERLQSLRSYAAEAEFERLALEAATEQMQRELALHLHGTVQAGLVASAYSIQDAVNRGDTVALEAAIANARASIASVGQDAGEPTAHDLASLRAASSERWDGAIAISWTLPATEPAPTLITRIDSVIQECLANASIHGAATEVEVRIVTEDTYLIIEITDNGRGLRPGTPGLGSAILNEATGGQWTIVSVPTGGTQVRAIVPHDPAKRTVVEADGRRSG